MLYDKDEMYTVGFIFPNLFFSQSLSGQIHPFMFETVLKHIYLNIVTPEDTTFLRKHFMFSL